MYKFRAALVGHSSDVRAVAAGICPEGSIVTCSRDETARLWLPDTDGAGFSSSQTFRGHAKYVVAACVMPPTDEFPGGLILTGSNDHNIHVYTPGGSEPLFRLTGHTGTVSALAAGKFGTIVSGSWDCSARVWLGQKCVLTLSGHSAAVWAVAILPGSGLVISGSADTTIIAWKTGKAIQKFTGHTDCVRGLALLSEDAFLSCSNDASIRHWNINGTCLRTLYGHSNFVYSVAVLPNGCDVVSAGEDRTVRVWRDGQLAQTIHLPAQSVWAVACLQNGDIAAGSSDGVCRVFSSVPERQAQADAQAAYQQEVSSTQMTKADLGGYKVSDLPGAEALLAPGHREGQTVMVREADGSVTCHVWSASDQLWNKVGDVVGASGGSTDTSGKVLHDGKEYDYVFTVDIKEDSPPLKLPYNVSEDAWSAAQRFIHLHDLSQAFLDQVANFIIKNSGGAGSTARPANTAQYSDPFTGQGRYVPDPGQPPAGSAPVPPPQQSQPQSPASPRYFPQDDYIFFDKGNVEGMATKLREFNQRAGDGGHRLEETTLQEMTKLAELDCQPAPHHLTALLSLLQWPKELAFPAIDLLRLAVLNSETCDFLCAEPQRAALLAALERFAQRDSPSANQMLALRTSCNLFRHASGEATVMAAREQVAAAALALLPATNRNVQVALATLLLNMATSLRRRGGLEARAQTLSALGVLLQRLADGEALFRALVGFGTLAAADRDMAALARSLEVQAVLERLRNVPEPAKVSACAGQLDELVRRS